MVGTVCVATKGKNRKENGNASEPPRPQPEQPLEEGMSDEIVRDFLVESSIESQPAGKQLGRSGPRRRRQQFCPGAAGQSGHAERHSKGFEPANPSRLPQIAFAAIKCSAKSASYCVARG